MYTPTVKITRRDELTTSNHIPLNSLLPLFLLSGHQSRRRRRCCGPEEEEESKGKVGWMLLG